MANVLSEEKRQQVLALGRLRWSLRRIEEATGVRRETASAYLKVAAIPVRAPRAPEFVPVGAWRPASGRDFEARRIDIWAKKVCDSMSRAAVLVRLYRRCKQQRYYRACLP